MFDTMSKTLGEEGFLPSVPEVIINNTREAYGRPMYINMTKVRPFTADEPMVFCHDSLCHNVTLNMTEYMPMGLSLTDHQAMANYARFHDDAYDLLHDWDLFDHDGRSHKEFYYSSDLIKPKDHGAYYLEMLNVLRTTCPQKYIMVITSGKYNQDRLPFYLRVDKIGREGGSGGTGILIFFISVFILSILLLLLVSIGENLEKKVRVYESRGMSPV